MDLITLPPWLERQLQAVFLGNTLQTYASAALTFALVLAAAYAARRILVAKLQALSAQTETDLDDFVVSLLGQIKNPEFLLLAFYIASRSLYVSASLERVIQLAFVVALTYRAVRLIQEALSFALKKTVVPEVADDPTSRSAFDNILLLLNGLLWVAGVLFVLDNLGIDVTALMTGLGIGGIAVALAAQALLGDLFSSFSIFMDKPFKVGDFLFVDNLRGTVEHIGVKTTRIRSLDGELLVVSNSDMTRSRIRNFGPMQQRRIVWNFGVAYATPRAKVAAIPKWVAAIVAKHPKVRLDRAHFKGFGDSSLDFEAVYFLDEPDYNLYMDIQQAINLDLMELFEKEAVSFAFPTRSIVLEPSPALEKVKF